MSFFPQRQFNGVPGEASADTGGPDMIERDLDEINKMFNPDVTHTGGTQGGISKGNLNFTVTNDYDNTEKAKVTTAYTHANTTDANPHATKAEQIANTAITGVAGTTVQATMEGLKAVADTKATQTDFSSHTSNTSNPHSVTKAQVGLGNADNTSDANKPISTATQTALDLKQTIADSDLLIKSVTFSEATGQFTFTKQGGGTILIDTNLEKVPGSMSLVEDPAGSGTYYLVIYDTSSPPQELSRCPVSALFNPLDVEDTSTVSLSLTTLSTGHKKLTATVVDGSLTFAKLASAVQNRITALEAAALNTVTATDTVSLTFTGNDLQANVKDGSITSAKLASGLYTEIQGFKTAAETAATNAAASASNASDYADAASGSATSASNKASEASGYATNASASATAASGSATESATYATNSSNSANQSSTYATTSGSKATLAESWAVGGTGTRTGEDTNNAKYWCEQAGQIAGGVFVTQVNNVSPTGGVSGPVTIDADDIGTTGTTNQFTNATEKATWNAKYDKPSTGVPDSDIASASTWNGKQNAITSATDLTVKTLTGGLTYSTTEPTAANTDGIKIVVLSSEPSTKYDGWLYLITG